MISKHEIVLLPLEQQEACHTGIFYRYTDNRLILILIHRMTNRDSGKASCMVSTFCTAAAGGIASLTDFRTAPGQVVTGTAPSLDHYLRRGCRDAGAGLDISGLLLQLLLNLAVEVNEFSIGVVRRINALQEFSILHEFEDGLISPGESGDVGKYCTIFFPALFLQPPDMT